jgi:hypothetical protein
MVYDTQDYWVFGLFCGLVFFVVLEYQTMDKVQKPNNPEENKVLK